MIAIFIVGMLLLVGVCMLIVGPLFQVAGVLAPFLILGFLAFGAIMLAVFVSSFEEGERNLGEIARDGFAAITGWLAYLAVLLLAGMVGAIVCLALGLHP
jgi:hypothetical protein